MKGFAADVGDWRAAALAAGVSATTISRALDDLVADERVLERVAHQAEHELSVADYLARLVSDARVATGMRMCREHEALLHRIERQFGVSQQVLVAIWGIESNFGEAAGTFHVVRALATLASHDRRRRSFWCAQLVAALTILDAGDVAAERFCGSWAGAMGHTQFMPTTYLEHAVDFDGDGRRDIWTSIADALASAANYLSVSGWKPHMPWGSEVTLGPGFDYSTYCDDERRTTEDWARAEVSLPTTLLQACNAGDRLSLLLAAGSEGPAFLTTCNFDALLAYNASNAYALAVAHLADRIDGGGGLCGQWPTAAPLSRDERVKLQRLLMAEGFDTGGDDGILGRLSRRAIRSYQLRCGLPGDGYHSRALLDRIERAAGVRSGRADADSRRGLAVGDCGKESS